ncbi:hypothetical protein ACFS07_00145 [Undibacterium arcticum]
MPKTAIAASTVASALASGIDVQTIDQSVRPQDDFFRYLNGKWLDATEIPADKSSWGSFYKLADDTQPQLRAIIEAAAQKPEQRGQLRSAEKSATSTPASWMKKTVDELGLTPLDHELAKIRALKDKKELPSLIAHLQQIGVGAPYDFGVHQDARDSTKYVVDFAQSGLGMPDRDYYLKLDDAKLADARAKYLVHVEKNADAGRRPERRRQCQADRGAGD